MEGGTQALRRTVDAHLEIEPGVDRRGVRAPAFGALVLKSAAYTSDTRDRDRHLFDAAALLACVDDPSRRSSTWGARTAAASPPSPHGSPTTTPPGGPSPGRPGRRDSSPSGSSRRRDRAPPPSGAGVGRRVAGAHRSAGSAPQEHGGPTRGGRLQQLQAERRPSSGRSRSPAPSTTGCTHRSRTSTRPSPTSVRASSALPTTWTLACRSLSAATSAARSGPSCVEPRHARSGAPRDTRPHPIPDGGVEQRRLQPPSVEPPEGSSSGPPGAWTTPSRLLRRSMTRRPLVVGRRPRTPRAVRSPPRP